MGFDVLLLDEKQNKSGPASEGVRVLALTSYIIEVLIEQVLRSPVVIDGLSEVASQGLVQIHRSLHIGIVITERVSGNIVQEVLVESTKYNVIH